MRKEIINSQTVLYADSGKLLTNGTVYTTEAWVGNDEWWEVDEEIPQEGEDV